MSHYRYVVFPRGKQPTTEDVRQWQQFAGLLANRFAWGVARDDGRLTVACDGGTFDHARDIDAGFDALVAKWQVLGCELVDHLGFVKDASALRPAAVVPLYGHDRHASVETMRTEERIAAKHTIAREAVARSLMGVERTLDRYAAFQRFASAVPYLLMAAGAIGTIAVGLYIRDRLQSSGRESRQATIERALDDAARDVDRGE
jgi:hypothetical protein